MWKVAAPCLARRPFRHEIAAGWRHPMTRPSRPAEKLPATAFSGSSFLFRKIARAMRTCGRSEIDRLNAIRTVTAGSATAEATEPGEDADQQAIVKDHENESDDASFDHLRGFLVNAPSTAPAPLLYPLPRSSRSSPLCASQQISAIYVGSGSNSCCYRVAIRSAACPRSAEITSCNLPKLDTIWTQGHCLAGRNNSDRASSRARSIR